MSDVVPCRHSFLLRQACLLGRCFFQVTAYRVLKEAVVFSPQAKTEEVGEPWLKVLLTKDYAQTTLDERVAMLTSLVHLTVDGPTIRNNLELRLEEQGKVRKKMWEDARVSLLSLASIPQLPSLIMLFQY